MRHCLTCVSLEQQVGEVHIYMQEASSELTIVGMMKRQLAVQ